MKTKKRFLSILLSLMLVLGLMMGMSTTAYAVYPGMDIGQRYTYNEIVSKRIDGSFIYFATYNLPEAAFNVGYAALENDYKKDYLLGKYDGSYTSYHTGAEDALNKESEVSIVQKRK